jgi:hypothetical protein
MQHKLKVSDIASIIHPYPTYNSGIQLLATEMAVEHSMTGVSGNFYSHSLQGCSLNLELRHSVQVCGLIGFADGVENRKQQRQTQIPFGNDNQKYSPNVQCCTPFAAKCLFDDSRI